MLFKAFFLLLTLNLVLLVGQIRATAAKDKELEELKGRLFNVNAKRLEPEETLELLKDFKFKLRGASPKVKREMSRLLEGLVILETIDDDACQAQRFGYAFNYNHDPRHNYPNINAYLKDYETKLINYCLQRHLQSVEQLEPSLKEFLDKYSNLVGYKPIFTSDDLVTNAASLITNQLLADHKDAQSISRFHIVEKFKSFRLNCERVKDSLKVGSGLLFWTTHSAMTRMSDKAYFEQWSKKYQICAPFANDDQDELYQQVFARINSNLGRD